MSGGGREILTAAQVARRFQRTARWFLRNRAALEARGFPTPIDGCGMRWDSAAIDDWLDRRRPERPVDPAQAMEAELIRRAAGMAGAAG